MLKFELASRIETADTSNVSYSPRPMSSFDYDKDLHSFGDELHLRRHVGALCQAV